MSPQRRLQQVFSWSSQLKQMALDAIRRRHPEFDANAVGLKFIESTYGKKLADEIRLWQEKRGLENSKLGYNGRSR